MRYRLRTLLIVLAIGPPVLAMAVKALSSAGEQREIEKRIRIRRINTDNYSKKRWTPLPGTSTSPTPYRRYP